MSSLQPIRRLTQPARTVAGRMSLARAGVLLLILSGASSAVHASPCKTLLAVAQEHYVEQRFAEAETAVHTCLGRPYLAPDDALSSYRLLTLLHLRQEQLTEAKHAVLQLLKVSFDYEPDPVADPPAFTALVEIVRDQLRVDTVAATEPPCACDDAESDEPPLLASNGPSTGAPSSDTKEAEVSQAPAALRSLRSVHLGVAVGGGSYSGERGINAPTLLGEFGQNGGVSFALDGTYYLTSTLAVAAQLHAVRFPLLLTNDVRHEDVQVRPEDSSEWVHALTVLARTLYRSDGRATPYFHLGLSGIVSRLNNKARIAVGPQVGFGVDVAATPRLSGFAEFNMLVAIPGDAVDRVDTSDGPGDLLTFAGVGVRYRLGVW